MVANILHFIYPLMKITDLLSPLLLICVPTFYEVSAQKFTVNTGVEFSLHGNLPWSLDGKQNGTIEANATWSQASIPFIIIDDPPDLTSSISGLGFVRGNDLNFNFEGFIKRVFLVIHRNVLQCKFQITVFEVS